MGKSLKDYSRPNAITFLPKDEGDQHGGLIGHMALPREFSHSRIFAHHNCLHNQQIAIQNRVLFDTGMLPDPEAAQYYLAACRRLGRSLGFTPPISYDAFLDHYSGGKRRRYEDAVAKCKTFGVSKQDARVEAFVKCDKIVFKEGLDKPNPDPRAIQFRDPVYSAEFGCYLKPIEHKIYNCSGSRSNGLPPGRQIAKGLNQLDKGLLYHQKWLSFKDPAGIVIDGTRFDAHVSEVLQRGEHLVYTSANPDPYFKWLLSLQIRNKCFSTRGIAYTVWYRRMSGDMNTAVGNCTIMTMMVASYFNRYFPDDYYQLIDDGDDCVILVERARKDVVFPLDGRLFYLHCSGLGMNIKVESHITSIEETSWCQSSPVLTPAGYKFIRNPAKVISGALVSPKWPQMKSAKSRAKLCNTIGMCEAILNLGIPMLQSFACALIRNSGTAATLRTFDQGEQLIYRVRNELRVSVLKRLPSVKPAEISMETRLSFAKAFGYDVDAQLYYERSFDAWRFSLEEPLELPDHMEVHQWLWEGFEPELC